MFNGSLKAGIKKKASTRCCEVFPSANLAVSQKTADGKQSDVACLLKMFKIRPSGEDLTKVEINAQLKKNSRQ